MASGSTSAFILAITRAGPRARVPGLARQLRDDRIMHSEGRLDEPVQLRGLREARELQEQLVHVLPDLIVARENAVVRVGPRRLWMIVAGAEMTVTADSAGLAPHDECHFGM